MLLILVLGIWGIIGYKILSAVNPGPPKLAEQYFDASFHPKPNTIKDTFTIQLADRDPFLGTLHVKKTPKKIKIRQKQPILWLPILYHGNVANQDGKSKIFIISIDNEQHLMRLGQEIKGVKLLQGNRSRIVMSYKGGRKTILKS